MKHLFVIATGSAGKIRDFAHILGTDHYEFKTLKDIGFDEDIIEDGKTFAENAIIKRPFSLTTPALKFSH